MASWLPCLGASSSVVVGPAWAPCEAGGAGEPIRCCCDPGTSVFFGLTIRRRSAPYCASIATESFWMAGAWLAKMAICSGDRVAGSTPASLRSCLATARRRDASSGVTWNGMKASEIASGAGCWGTAVPLCGGSTRALAPGLCCVVSRLPLLAHGAALSVGAAVVPLSGATAGPSVLPWSFFFRLLLGGP